MMSSAAFPYYISPKPGEVATQPAEPLTIEPAPRHGLDAPDRYFADDDLQSAVNTALLLGQPLLVTGRPGCGKTQLGKAVAYALGYLHFKFDTKSTSQAKDLFYLFDVVGRFQARQVGGSADPRNFIRYQALGLAILLSHRRQDVEKILPLLKGAGDDAILASDWGEGCRSVVVIDEVDKAPRDFPNDILNEVEQLSFTVPEIEGYRVPPPEAYRPFVVLTSNSEKQLPDAFLRRCVYYHIQEPKQERLLEIVSARLGPSRFDGTVGAAMGNRFGLEKTDELVKSAVNFFAMLRDGTTLHDGSLVTLKKPPGIAELLNWLQALVGMGANRTLRLEAQAPGLIEQSLTVLLKYNEDRETAIGRVSDTPQGVLPSRLDNLLRRAAEAEPA
jgi:MoxR-like ATPase